MFRSVYALFAAIIIAAFTTAAGAQPQLPGMGTASTSAAAPQSAPAAPPESAGASEFWASIRDSNDPAQFEEYLRRYPNHAFAPLARSKLNALRGQSAVAAQPGQPMAAAPPADGPQSIFGAPSGQPQVAGPQLAANLQSALKNIGCYTSSVDGDWGRGSRAAAQRFNALTGANIPAEVPTQEALAAVTSWGGGNCKAVAARKTRKVTRRKTTSKKQKTTASSRKKAPSGGGSIGIIIGGGRGGIGIGF